MRKGENAQYLIRKMYLTEKDIKLLEMLKPDKQNTKEMIWELLRANGFTKFRSASVLKKNGIKYKFGEKNLRKYIGSKKQYSIAYGKLTIIKGKIALKETE